MRLVIVELAGKVTEDHREDSSAMSDNSSEEDTDALDDQDSLHDSDIDMSAVNNNISPIL